MSLLDTLPEAHAKLRGHRFYGEELSSAPALYATEDTPRDEKVAVAHYFLGSSDWWIIEVDPDTGIAFGYACLSGDVSNAELGYISLLELEGIVIQGIHIVERDLDWQPTPLKRILDALNNG